MGTLNTYQAPFLDSNWIIITANTVSVNHLPWEFASRICRGFLPREFAAGICRGFLPREFAAGNALYALTLTNGRTYWECARRRSGNGYNVKITLDAVDRFVVETHQCTHAADPEGNDLLKEIAGIKRSAKDTAGKA